MNDPTTILIVSVNARYSHASYAARTLQANVGRWSSATAILETDLEVTAIQLAEQIVARHPRIVTFTAYLWNIRLIEAVARILRQVMPDVRLIAGGPELTPEYAYVSLFDTIVIGEGETTFRTCCEQWLSDGQSKREERGCIIVAEPEDPARLLLPFDYYTETDLARRTIYVETSRGCMASCPYCTSARTGLRLIPTETLFAGLDRLWQRGVRQFKFLDRSFNAPVRHAVAVLDFFLPRVTPETCLHFEINPDALHPEIAERLRVFPKGTLHLEVGLQTLNPAVARAMGRSPDTARTLEHLRFLTKETGAVVHADLIFGLPGEDEHSFAEGFDRLMTMAAPPEVQVNLLKGLPGTRLAHEAEAFGLVFNPEPPYELLQSPQMDFETLSRIQRFSRCWELVYNRRPFPEWVEAFHARIGTAYYQAYGALADRIYAQEGRLYAIARPRLAAYLQLHQQQ